MGVKVEVTAVRQVSEFVVALSVAIDGNERVYRFVLDNRPPLATMLADEALSRDIEEPSDYKALYAVVRRFLRGEPMVFPLRIRE